MNSEGFGEDTSGRISKSLDQKESFRSIFLVFEHEYEGAFEETHLKIHNEF
jgi:hypothetical protein